MNEKDCRHIRPPAEICAVDDAISKVNFTLDRIGQKWTNQ